MCAALRRSQPGVAVAVAPPAALPRAPGWRDRWRAARAGRRGAGVEIAAGVVMGRGVVFDLAAGARVVVGAGVDLGDRCRFHVGPGATVTVGAGTRMGERCVITANERVTIGARCLLADEVVLVDASPSFADAERPLREQPLTTAPVTIGDGVRIGPSAAILRGVTIGDGAAVGAHAVVTHDVAAGGGVEGMPAARRPSASRSTPARGRGI
jgi:acetyltransferase-like isoleucine patch superfamily enzyme